MQMRPLLVSSLCLCLLAAVTAIGARPSRPTAPRVSRTIASGLRFEANAGQTDPSVRFLAHGRGYTLFLTADAAVFALPSDVVRMRFARAAEIAAEEPLAARSHYLLGDDPAAWHTDVPTFGRVVYRGVQPGVDLVFRSDGDRLEYDFVAQPGADAGAIRVAFEGSAGISVDAAGDLRLATSSDALVHCAPRSYELRDGARREVPGRFVLEGPTTVRYEVASHDRDAELVIDPVVQLASYLGAAGEEQAYGAGVDAAGNFYVAGITNSPTFPTTPGVIAPTIRGGIDTFVSKFDANGALLWSTFLGGLSKDAVTDMAVDASGAVYVVGSTASPNFPTVNAAQPTPSTVPEAFVAKLAPTGASLVYSTYLGGSGADAAWGIAPDANGNACVGGETTSPDFPTASPAQPTIGGLTDAVVARFSATGALLYATYLGGSKEDIARGIAATPSGSCIAAGQTISTDFPVFAAFQPTLAGNIESFVAKYDPAGARVYATYLGGTQSETARAIATDATGAAYVTGGTYSPDFPTRNPIQSLNRGQRDAFVTKLTPDGSALAYSTFLGGTGAENLVDFGVPVGGTIAVDRTGAVYITGSTASTDFPTLDPFQATAGGGGDAFVAKLTPDGARLAYASYLGGGDYDDARAIAVDGAGRAYVAGETFSHDFPSVAPFQATHGGGLTDAFFAKIVPPSGVLSCDVEMSQAAYVDGQTVTATSLHFGNASAGPQPAQLRLLITVPGGSPTAVISIGGDGTLYLPSDLDAQLAPVPLLPVTSGLARGDYAFGCELVDPLTGAVLASDTAPFAVQ
jgi:Beta-propeller repeat